MQLERNGISSLKEAKFASCQPDFTSRSHGDTELRMKEYEAKGGYATENVLSNISPALISEISMFVIDATHYQCSPSRGVH